MKLRPVTLEGEFQLDAHNAVLVVVQFPLQPAAAFKHDRLEFLNHRGALETNIFRRRMTEDWFAARLHSEDLPQRIQIDLLADVVEPENPQRPSKRSLRHSEPIITEAVLARPA